MKSVLFLCRSPLQVEIVRNKIIYHQNLQQRVVILYFDDFYNHKNKLSCCGFENNKTKIYYFVKQSFISDVISIFQLINHYNVVYIASINNFYFQLLLSYSKKDELITFDDGTASLLESSILHNSKDSFLKKNIRLIFNIKENAETIKAKASKHCTIYSTRNCLYKSKLEYINLFSEHKEAGCLLIKDEITIWLGACYQELTNVRNSDRFFSIVSSNLEYYAINTENFNYLPHPRENCNFKFKVTYNRPTMLTEYFILGLLNRYSRIKIVGFGSSVQYNLSNNQRIQIVILKSKYIKKIFRTEALFFDKKYKTICID